MENFDELNADQLGNLGMFPKVEKRYDEQQNIYWVVSNQKILTVDPAVLGIREPNSSGEATARTSSREATGPTEEISTRPGGFRISLKNFLHSLVDFFIGLLSWLSGSRTERKQTEPEHPTIDRNNGFIWTFENNPKNKVRFRVVRTSECPNDDSEYGRYSVNVLVEWNQTFAVPPGDLTAFEGLYAQVDNIFIVNPEANSKPSWPPQSTGHVIHVYDSDFMPFTSTGPIDDNDRQYYSQIASGNNNAPIVAVMDTGLAYKWKNTVSGNKGRAYTTTDQELTSFLIARAQPGSCLPGADFGYCGITEYLRRPVRFNRLAILNTIDPAQVLVSPYDDNLVDEEVLENGNPVRNERVGRHGTLIAAILNKPILNNPGCQVLPVKVFDGAGKGTLFDLLCGCNYILSRKRAGMPIKVLNASFSGSLNKPGKELLYRKMKALTETHGIWVIAAAGNKHIDLDKTPLYPASFGVSKANGGLEKVITVTSAYSGGGIVGNFGKAVSIKARSAFPDGFKSVLPVTNTARLRGTSFAAPYAAAVLANATALSSRTDALTYLKANPVPGTVTFEDPF